MNPSTSRLAVLGWQALRSTRGARTNTNAGGFSQTASGRAARRQQHVAWKSSFAPRVGKAVEPVTQAEGEAVEEDTKQDTKQEVKKGDQQAQSQTPAQAQPQMQQAEEETPEQQTCTTKSVVKTDDPGTTEFTAEGVRASKIGGGDATPKAEGADGEVKHTGGPLEKVLHMEPPSSSEGKTTDATANDPPNPYKRQHPHMAPPPYVHHFDSYSLVKHLGEGGYTTAQSIEAMKGIRALLAQNLDVAQESLVSKSDVENETYLFSAACSELGQEIKNNRRLRDEQIRQQRTHLQHEVDILTQSLNQAASTLSDDVRGMFNDRRMAVREEQKTAESAIQQINYKISTSLVSDSKSEIEGVRWILIRRSALGIFFMAMLTLGTVRYATYLLQERQREAERRKEELELLRREAGRRDDTSAADAAAILTAN